LLTGKYRRGEQPAPDTRLGHSTPERVERSLSERTFDRLERLNAFAKQHDHTLLELAFGWLLAIPQVVSVIAGATRPEQARANVDAANWVLTQQEFEQVAQLARG
jgi:aryl-alcohol dehydrogenase-like predicted oxidoreductase